MLAGTPLAQRYIGNLKQDLDMIVYKTKRRSTVLKVIVGLIVFVTAMCMTFGDVVGAI